MTRFTVVDELGRGGLGVVYRVMDALQGEEVALKTSSADDPARLAQLRAEYRIVRRVHHPNLAPPWELFDSPEAATLVSPPLPPPFFTMPILAGRGIDEEFDVLPTYEARLDRLRRILPGMLDGLAELHARGLIHGDVKPSNLFVHGDHATWFDFGMSRTLDDATAVAGGTIMYMTPQALRGEQLDQSTDIYGLAVLLFYCLTGQLPFDPVPLAAWAQKVEGSAQRLRQLVPQGSPEIERVLAQGLHPASAARPTLEQFSQAFGVRAPHQPPRVTEVFLGRDQQLDLLERALHRAQGGSSVIVNVHGPSGIGKSTILRHFTESHAQDCFVVRGACDPQASVSYDALAAALDRLSAELGLHHHLASTLAEADIAHASVLFPTLAQLATRAHPEEPGDPGERRVRAVAALRRILSKVSQYRPLIVVLDDLQWAAEDTRNLIAELHAHPDAAPTLWVLASREGTRTHDAWLLSTEITTTDCAVGPLSNAEIGTTWTALGGPAQLLDTVVAEAGGNPYLVRFLAENLPVDGIGGDAPVVAFWAAVQNALAALPATSRRVVELACVAEGSLLRSALLVAADLRAADRPMLAYLEDRAWLATDDATDDLVVPYHARIGDVVATTIDAVTMRSHHRSLYEALVRWRVSDARLYAHALGAGMTREAGGHARAAAAAAMERLAFLDAASWFQRAQDCATPDETSALVEARAYALVCAGRSRDAAAVYIQAAECATGAAEMVRQRAISLRTRAAGHLLTSGAVEEGKALWATVFAEVGEPMPRSEVAAQLEGMWHRVLMLFAWKIRNEGRPIPKDVALRLEVLYSAAWSFGLQFAALADTLQLRNLRLARRYGAVGNLVKGYMHEISLESAIGGKFMVNRAEAMLVELRRLAGTDPDSIGRGHGGELSLAWSRGQWKRCIDASLQGEATFANHRRDARYDIGTFRTFRFSALWWSGDLPRMFTEVDTLLDEARSLGDTLQEQTYSLGECSSLDLVRDNPGRALEHAAAALKLWTPGTPSTQRYLRLHGVMRAHLYMGDPEAAWREIEQEWGTLKAGMYATLVPTACILQTGRAAVAVELAARATDATSRRNWLAEAGKSIRAIRPCTTWDPAVAIATLLDSGVAHVEGRADAPSLLAHAADLLDSVDMPMHAAAARAVHPDPALAERGIAHLRSLTVVDPTRFAGCLVAGWTS